MLTGAEDWYDSNCHRREFLRRLGLMGIGLSGLVGFGCGRSGRSGEPSQIRMYGTGTLDIAPDGWKQLARDLGIEMSFTDNGNDTGPVMAQMIAGNAREDYDIGGLQGGAERELAEAEAIIPWDVNSLPNWNSAWEMARNIPYTQVNGEQYGIPIALNADSIIYLPAPISRVDGYEGGIVDSYSAVFDERLRGRTAMEDAWINSAIFAAIYLKESGMVAIGDPGNLTESELSDVMGFLIDLKRAGQFRKFWKGWEQGVDLVASGEVWAMTGWEPIVYELQRRGIDAHYAEPKEGYEGWSNDLLLHAGAHRDRLEIAHEVANWLLGGYYGCRLAALRGYAVPCDTSVTYAKQSAEFDPATVADLAAHVKGKFERGGGQTHWQNVRPENHALYDEWWTKLRNTVPA